MNHFVRLSTALVLAIGYGNQAAADTFRQPLDPHGNPITKEVPVISYEPPTQGDDQGAAPDLEKCIIELPKLDPKLPPYMNMWQVCEDLLKVTPPWPIDIDEFHIWDQEQRLKEISVPLPRYQR